LIDDAPYVEKMLVNYHLNYKINDQEINLNLHLNEHFEQKCCLSKRALRENLVLFSFTKTLSLADRLMIVIRRCCKS